MPPCQRRRGAVGAPGTQQQAPSGKPRRWPAVRPWSLGTVGVDRRLTVHAVRSVQLLVPGAIGTTRSTASARASRWRRSAAASSSSATTRWTARPGVRLAARAVPGAGDLATAQRREQRQDSVQPTRRTKRPWLRSDAGRQVFRRGRGTRLHRADQARLVRLENGRTRSQGNHLEDHDGAPAPGRPPPTTGLTGFRPTIPFHGSRSETTTGPGARP